MPAQDPAKQLAKEISTLRREVNSISRASQMGRRSLQGAGIPVYDADGKPRGTFGMLPDGTTGFTTVNGPKPVAPAAPILFPLVGGLEVTWNGETFDGSPLPGDFRCVEVHASPYSVYTPDETTLRANLIRGGTITLSLPAQDWTVVFVMRSTAGATSDPSVSATERPEHAPTAAEIEALRQEAASGDEAALEAAQAATQKADQALLDANAATISADGKNMVFWRSSANPPPSPLIDGDLWFVTDMDNRPRIRKDGVWEDATLGDAALAGLNVGKLTTGQIAVGQRIIAGIVTGTHAEMSDDGFRVYLEDPVDGVPDVVVRMGTGSDDTIGISNASGDLVASLDQTGSVNARTANFREDIVVGGQALTKKISDTARGLVGRWAGPINGLEFFSQTTGIRGVYGIAQFKVPVVKGRMYLFSLQGPMWYPAFGTGNAHLQFRVARNADVTVSSEVLWDWPHPEFGKDARIRRPYVLDWVADFTGTASIGVTMHMTEPSTTDAHIKIVEGSLFSAMAFDMGPSIGSTGGNQTGMGGQLFNGAPPPPPPPSVASHFVELAPAGWQAWGDRGLRTDVPGPVQGRDPSGYNGEGRGHWWFNLPSITGTITNMEFYCYSNHWYYNDGGPAVFNLARQGAGGPDYVKYQADWIPSGYWPKPGGRTVQLPQDWWEQFTTHPPAGKPKADGVIVGPTGGNLREYGRFDGASARLRVWYTQ